MGTQTGRHDDFGDRALFMLWQDACELSAFLAASHLDEAGFLAAPLNRASVMRGLAACGVHARALDPSVTTGIAGVDWAVLRALPAPDDGRLPYTMDEAAQRDAWRVATGTVPELRRRIANDARVVRVRARWDALAHRAEQDWPQPDPSRKPSDPAVRERLGALSEAARAVAPAIGPVLRAWLLPDAPEDGPARTTGTVTLALECTEAMTDTDARALVRGLAAHGGAPRGEADAIQLIPQAMVHPLLWDDVVGRELLVWARLGTASARCAPVALLGRLHHHSS